MSKIGHLDCTQSVMPSYAPQPFSFSWPTAARVTGTVKKSKLTKFGWDYYLVGIKLRRNRTNLILHAPATENAAT